MIGIPVNPNDNLDAKANQSVCRTDKQVVRTSCAFPVQAALGDCNPSKHLTVYICTHKPNLHADLDSALVTRCALLTQAWQQVGDIIPRMPIQASAETLLIQVVSN